MSHKIDRIYNFMKHHTTTKYISRVDSPSSIKTTPTSRTRTMNMDSPGIVQTSEVSINVK